jgi:hypothetical protein
MENWLKPLHQLDQPFGNLRAEREYLLKTYRFLEVAWVKERDPQQANFNWSLFS